MSFIPDLPTLLAFTAAGLVLAITPGPDMTLQISRALSDGRKAGFACGAGALTGVLVHTLLVALGVSALVVALPVAFLALKIFGALYLLWLAVQAIRSGSSLNVIASRKTEKSLWRHYIQGVGVNLLNPKVVLFFMTFLPQFVRADDPAITGKLIFLGIYFNLVSIPVLAAIVLGAHGLSAWLRTRPGIMRVIDYLFAGVFSLFAVKILFAQSR